MSVGFLLPGNPGEYQAVLEEFPAYGSVLLRLALVNLRTVRVCYSTSHLLFNSSGADISAALCMLPCSPDCIIRSTYERSGVQSLRMLESSEDDLVRIPSVSAIVHVAPDPKNLFDSVTA